MAAHSNPALNDSSFARAVAETGAAPRGFSAVVTYIITVVLLAILVGAACFGWTQVEMVEVGTGTVAKIPRWTWLVVFLTFIVGLVGIFNYRLAPITSLIYAAGQGTVLGIVSRVYDEEWDGIVVQAVAATVAIFAAMLVLYLTRIIKVTRGYMTMLVGAMFGLLILWFMFWIFSLFGANVTFYDDPSPFGILLAVGVVALGALNLPADFNFIEEASKRGAPGFMMWYAGFGLMLSIIWIYVSVLRLLALLRMSQ